ncbi:hypothetical protein [Klebsiella pneumoniae]|uniref:hypothetical protein n=1 Tax=Klebsiella pneumoniae TaxID=573 RepID=UPI000E3487C4|nr:hypothetical protein [Klebsiella pneumoniae]
MHFYIFFDGADYYATPHKYRAEEWPGGVLYEYGADPDDDQSLAGMAGYVSEQAGEMISLQFSW